MEQANPTPAGQNNQHAAGATPTPAGPVKVSLQIGQTARSNGLEVTVKSARIADHYEWGSGGFSSPQNAPQGKKFLIAQVEIKNVDSSASTEKYVILSDFSATDSEGNAYDSEFSLMEDALVSKTLFQNQKTEGSVLFEINDNAQNVKILYNFGNLFAGTRLAEWSVP